MVDMDGPLDFEREDPLVNSAVINKKRRKANVLTRNKRAKSYKNYNSDEDDDSKEVKLSESINKLQNQIGEIGSEEEIYDWGLAVFGNQKPPPSLVFPEIRSCLLLQSFINNEYNSLVELTTEKGDTFLEGLLVNGCTKLVFTCGHVEKSIATWMFNLMLYSSKEELRMSASHLWCAFSSENKILVTQGHLKILEPG